MRKFFCLMAAVALFAGVASAEVVEFTITDSNGSQVSGCHVGVTVDGRVVAKLPAAPDGIYSADVTRGDKLTFEVIDPSLSPFNKAEIMVPMDIVGPVQVQLPTAPNVTQGTPANDECAAAIDVGALPALVAGSTINSTLDGSAPVCDGATITAGGVWYSVTGTGNDMVASTCNLQTPPGSADYDTKISVYCLGCDGDGPICVVGNDDEANGSCGFNFASTAEWSSEAGAEYLILVHGFGTATGSFELSVFEGGAGNVPVQCTPPEPEGACCVTTCNDPVTIECSVGTATACADAGGEYQGDDTLCFNPTGETAGGTSSPAVAIPDAGGEANPVNDTITVDAPGCLVADVTVDVIITHSWVGDLQINVTGPTGLTSNLFDERCGSTDNIDTTFSDGGTTTSCAELNAPGTGDIDPTLSGLGPALAQFGGTEASGDWTLNVYDNFAADTGTLDFWAVNISCGEEICTVPEPEPMPQPTGDDEDSSSSSNSGFWWWNYEGDAGISLENHDNDNPGGFQLNGTTSARRHAAGQRVPRR